MADQQFQDERVHEMSSVILQLVTEQEYLLIMESIQEGRFDPSAISSFPRTNVPEFVFDNTVTNTFDSSMLIFPEEMPVDDVFQCQSQRFAGSSDEYKTNQVLSSEAMWAYFAALRSYEIPQ